MADTVIINGREFEVCPCCGKPKRPVGEEHPLPDCPVRILAEQSGENTSRPFMGNGAHRKVYEDGMEYSQRGYSDTGTAARFFYTAKASKSERNLGCDHLYWRKDKDAPIGFVRITKEEWGELPSRQRAEGNIHPTVKPLEVLQYLARLIIPPEREEEPRRLVVPFSGSGSEMVAGLKEGWEDVTGIELYQDYSDIAMARIKAFTRQPGLL